MSIAVTLAAAAASVSSPIVPAGQAKTPNYLHPETSLLVDSPMPVMQGSSVVAGVYYNILFPEDRQNRCRPELREFFKGALLGDAPEFLTEDQLETINSYALLNMPKVVLVDCRLAPLTLQYLKEGKSIQEALCQAIEKIKSEDIPRYKAIVERLESLQTAFPAGGATHQRYSILIDAVNECVKSPDKALETRARMFESEAKKGAKECVALLERWGVELPSTLSDEEKRLELFENRRKVMVEAIKELFAKLPNGATFAAFQEATPDAVQELQDDLKERLPTWISFNNLTGKETEVKSKEDVCGESAAFTSTLALSRELKVHRVALGALPSPSGSERRILGVEVENEKTHRHFAIFTTHTDHIPKSYNDTVVKVHAFVQEFVKDNKELPIVFGGDLNAFEQSGGANFINEMRQGPFAGGKEYREGFSFYVHRSVADATYIGRDSDGFKPKIVEGKLDRNALDHILTKNIQVVAGTRSAVVYDENGKLVDPYTNPKLYQQRLEKRRTASDHLLNAIIFRG